MQILRRLRAAVGIGTTWAIGWGAAAGIIFPLVLLAIDPQTRSEAGWGDAMLGLVLTSLMAAVTAGTLGAIAGLMFALLLRTGEETRSVDQLSLRRTTLLGGAGSLALYVGASGALEVLLPQLSIGIGFVTGTVLGAGLITAFGAASAAMTLRLAQGASIDAPDEMALMAAVQRSASSSERARQVAGVRREG